MQHGEHKCCLWCCKKYKRIKYLGYIYFWYIPIVQVWYWNNKVYDRSALQDLLSLTSVIYWSLWRAIFKRKELHLNWWNYILERCSCCIYRNWCLEKIPKKCLKANVEYCNHNHKMLYTYKSQFFVAKTCIIPNVCW